MPEICVNEDCGAAASSSCGACGLVWYCSSQCQKEDWKENHKKECLDRKKLSSILTNSLDVETIVLRMLSISNRLLIINHVSKGIEIGEKCLAFLQRQCGSTIPGTCYCMMQNGTKVDNYLHVQNLAFLSELYDSIPESVETDDRIIFYASESLRLYLQRKQAGKGVDLMPFVKCNSSLGRVYAARRELDKADYHFEQNLAAVRQYRIITFS